MSSVGYSRWVGVQDREAARLDAVEDEFLAVAVTCANPACETKYDPRLHCATTQSPAYVELEECPVCGCGEIL